MGKLFTIPIGIYPRSLGQISRTKSFNIHVFRIKPIIKNNGGKENNIHFLVSNVSIIETWYSIKIVLLTYFIQYPCIYINHFSILLHVNILVQHILPIVFGLVFVHSKCNVKNGMEIRVIKREIDSPRVYRVCNFHTWNADVSGTQLKRINFHFRSYKGGQVNKFLCSYYYNIKR